MINLCADNVWCGVVCADIRKWIQDVRTHAEQSVNIVLIGNKCDLTDKKVGIGFNQHVALLLPSVLTDVRCACVLCV